MPLAHTYSMSFVQDNCANQIFTRKANIVDEMYGKCIGGNNIDPFLQEHIQKANEYNSMLYINKYMSK